MIYQTPYNPENRETTGPSLPTPFVSMDHVRQVFGEPPKRGINCIAYPDRKVAYSTFVISLE